MKKILIFILTISITIAGFTFFAAVACDNGSGENDSPETWPRTVIDHLDREVTIIAPPQRIISGFAMPTSALLALGLQDRIAGTELFRETRPIFALAAHNLINNPDIITTGNVSNFNTEYALAAEPDLVIVSGNPNHVAAAQLLYDTFNIPAIVVKAEHHDTLIEMLEMIGYMTGTEDRATALIAYHNNQIARINTLTQGLAQADRPSVMMTNPGNLLSTAPRDMFQSSLVSIAGGVNAFNNLTGTGWVGISYEQLAVANPDIIIIPTNNIATENNQGILTRLLETAALSNVDAVSNGNIFFIPYGLEAFDTPLPAGILGTLWLTHILHPDLLTMDELVYEFQYFYYNFFNIILNQTLITRIRNSANPVA